MATDSTESTPRIVKLREADLANLEALLQENQLPTDDCADQLSAFYGVFDQGQLVAAGGLEQAGQHGLLRSVVVDTGHRGQGLGQTLSEYLIAEARRQGFSSVCLLTETADAYFPRLGFVRIERDLAPQSIKNTRQFAGLCPDSAVLMQLSL